MEGKSYADIANMGGGIMQTVQSTRHASDEQLYRIGMNRLKESLQNGTTFLEAKSGYGLSTKDELRLLNIVRSAQEGIECPIHSLDMDGCSCSDSRAYLCVVYRGDLVGTITKSFGF